MYKPSLFLLVCILLPCVFAVQVGDTAFTWSFRTSNSLSGWTTSSRASLVTPGYVSGAYALQIDARTADASINYDLDLSNYKGCTLKLSGILKATDVTKPSASYLGIKTMFVQTDAAGIAYDNKGNVYGTWGWNTTAADRSVTVSTSYVSARLSLGVQESRGIVQWDSVKLVVTAVPATVTVRAATPRPATAAPATPRPATSAPVAAAAGAPFHVYMTFNGNVKNMVVTFTTLSPVPSGAQLIWWDYNNGAHYIAISASNAKTFVRPLGQGTQYINTVTLGTGTNMVSGKNYTYQIKLVAGDSTTWTPVYDFRGLPTATEPITLGIYGDVGSYGPIITSDSSTGLKAFARNHAIDLILHNGDLAYDLDEKNGTVGEQFMANIEQIAARIPYTVSPGNHEYNHNALAYYNGYWSGQTVLGQLSNSSSPLLWYSFDISFAHIVVINTEVVCEDTTKVAAHWAWLDNDLSKFRAKGNSNWLFVIGHRQMYLGNTGAFDSYFQRFGFNCTNPTNWATCNVRKPCYTNVPSQCGFAIEPLFFKYKVDFSFEGHQHLYQRFYPIGPNSIYEQQSNTKYVNPKYPIHVISGAGGMQDAPPAAKRAEHAAQEAMAAAPQVAKTVGTAISGTAVVDIASFTTARIYNTTHVEFKQITPLQTAPVDAWWVVKDSTTPAAATGTFTVTPTTATGCQ